jgi:hypothetical protein
VAFVRVEPESEYFVRVMASSTEAPRISAVSLFRGGSDPIAVGV